MHYVTRRIMHTVQGYRDTRVCIRARNTPEHYDSTAWTPWIAFVGLALKIYQGPHLDTGENESSCVNESDESKGYVRSETRPQTTLCNRLKPMMLHFFAYFLLDDEISRRGWTSDKTRQEVTTSCKTRGSRTRCSSLLTDLCDRGSADSWWVFKYA